MPPQHGPQPSVQLTYQTPESRALPTSSPETGALSFPKNSPKAKKEAGKQGRHRGKVKYFQNPHEGQRDFSDRVRLSLLCSHHNSSKNGIRERTKKKGPPRV